MRIDLNRNIIYANDAFYKISGYTKEDLIGKPYSYLKHCDLTSEEEGKKIDSIFNGNIWKGKISNFKKNGQVFHCNVTMYPLKDKDGKVIEYMGIRHDITDIERLHDELEDAQREIIYKLGEIGECRSLETGQHVKRVAEYSKLLATKIGLSQKDINKLFMASPMHDIGKVGIPDSILNKNGKLDSAEWEVMKTHAKIGYEILRTSKREDIHIFGRITSIADVFDALSSDRVYKKAWPLEEVLELFNEEKGKHFDPKLIDIFMDNLDEFLQIKDTFRDIN